jgi:hypothetical protein
MSVVDNKPGKEVNPYFSKDIVASVEMPLPMEFYRNGVYKGPVSLGYLKQKKDVVALAGVGLGSSALASTAIVIFEPALAIFTMGVGIAYSCAALLSGMAKGSIKRYSLNVEHMLDDADFALKQWLKNEYNLKVDPNVIRDLNLFYIEGILIEGKDYPNFKDVKGNTYKLIPDPASEFKDSPRSPKIVVEISTENKLSLGKDENLVVLELESKKRNLDESQQALYENIIKKVTLLKNFHLSVEETYNVRHIAETLEEVISLHEQALSLNATSYNSKTLNEILTKFSEEIEHIVNSQSNKISHKLEVYRQIGLTK